MLEESPRVAEILAIAGGVLGASIVVAAIVLRKSIFMVGLGAVIGAAALAAPMVLRGQPTTVLMVTAQADGPAVVRRDGFFDGQYTARDGAVLEIKRDSGWGPLSTVIVNDSDRLVTVTGFGEGPPPQGAEDPPWPLTRLPPGTARVFRGRIGEWGPAGARSETRYYLGYAATPFSGDGSEAALATGYAGPEPLALMRFRAP